MARAPTAFRAFRRSGALALSGVRSYGRFHGIRRKSAPADACGAGAEGARQGGRPRGRGSPRRGRGYAGACMHMQGSYIICACMISYISCVACARMIAWAHAINRTNHRACLLAHLRRMLAHAHARLALRSGQRLHACAGANRWATRMGRAHAMSRMAYCERMRRMLN